MKLHTIPYPESEKAFKGILNGVTTFIPRYKWMNDVDKIKHFDSGMRSIRVHYIDDKTVVVWPTHTNHLPDEHLAIFHHLYGYSPNAINKWLVTAMDALKDGKSLEVRAYLHRLSTIENTGILPRPPKQLLKSAMETMKARNIDLTKRLWR